MTNTTNIFAEFQQKKQAVAAAASKALDFGWINQDDYDSLLKKLDDDKLTIGVIGQMKCGKSTFLNAFVFEDDVLPAATTPKTAALSLITYGPEKKIEAEFYSPDEWAEQKLTAQKRLDDADDDLTRSQVQSAQELVAKSKLLPGPVESFLGQTRTDSFDHLEDYVGADGKFVSITKAVKIFYPKDYLKGVEIVDTPGFNDPIVSREERTKDFLKRADVVLLMLYAGRPFDATDRQILFKNVGVCGTGRVLIGINKYDLPYENGESEDKIKDYVENELTKAADLEKNDDIAQILKRTKPVPLSASMALLAEMPMAKVSADEAYSFSYQKLSGIFEVNGQQQFRAKSHIDDLIAQVREVIENEKAEILIRKPANALKAKGEIKKADIAQKEQAQRMIAADALKSDDELDDKLEDFAKVDKKINRKLNTLEDEIGGAYHAVIFDAQRAIDDIVDEVKSQYSEIEAEEPGFLKEVIRVLTTGSASTKHTSDLKRCRTNCEKKVRDALLGAAKDCKEKIRKAVGDFAYEVRDIVNDKLEDYDANGLVSKIKNEVNLKIDGVYGEMKDFLKNGDIFEFKPEPALEPLDLLRDDIIALVRDTVLTQGIGEFRDMLQKLKDDKAGREKKGKEAAAEADRLHDQLLTVEQQIKELQAVL